MIKKHVFISYKSDEKKNALELRLHLEERGISCWMDESGIFIGENYATVISEAVEDSFAVVIVFSRKSVNSIHVQSEINIAVQNSVPVFAFAIEDFDPFVEYNFNIPLADRYKAFENKEDAYNQLIERLDVLSSSAENDEYNVRQFFKNRRRYLSKKRAKKGYVPLSRRIFGIFIPYLREFSQIQNVRLSLHILTACSVLCAFITGMSGYGTVLKEYWSLYSLSVPIGIVMGLVSFFAGEAASGVICRLIGNIRNKATVIVLSVIIGSQMVNFLYQILMIIAFQRGIA